MVPELNNHEKIGRALEHLRRGLLPLIKSRLALKHIANWQSRSIHGANRSSEELDVKDCLEIVNRFWDDKYSGPRLGRGERAWVNELIAKVRNQHAHRTAPEDISYDDTWRALDTAERLLAAMQSPESRNIRLLRMSMRAEAPIAKPERVEAQSIAPQPAFESPRNQRQKGAYIESLYAPDLLGGITVVGSRRGLISIRFGQGENKPGPTVEEAESQLREYADGRRKTFDLLWDVDGTPFQVEVWRALTKIPFGETCSYADIARAVLNPKGAQAVGQANSRNPLLLIIPCHRVINADGSLGGWGPGLEKKQQLLAMEGHFLKLNNFKIER